MATIEQTRDVTAVLVRMPAAMKRALRIAAAEEETSVEGYIRELIGQDLRERADERDLAAVK